MMEEMVEHRRRSLCLKGCDSIVDCRGGSRTAPTICRHSRFLQIRKHGYALTPGCYVGAAPQEDDGEPFSEKMKRLTAQWREQQAQARKLDAAIGASLKELWYGG